MVLISLDPEIAKKLFQLSSNRCAFPKCKKKLIDSDGYMRGEICCIESNKINLVRFNAKITEEQIVSFDNLILLCDEHHFEIEVKDKKFPVKLLQEWKLKSKKPNEDKNFQVGDEIIARAIQKFIEYQPFERFQIPEKDLYNDKIPLGIKLKREVASYIGITMCGKCGTRTKMKSMESIPSKTRDEWIGYTTCPKCGNKEKWLSGSEDSGGG